MAIYHFSQTVITTGSGNSAVAAAAYRHSAQMFGEKYARVFEFARKPEHVHSELALPADAPEWACKLADNHRRTLGQQADDGAWVRETANGQEEMIPLEGTADVGRRFVGVEAVAASSRFWNEVEGSENRTRTQYAHEVDVALPLELTREENIALVREFVQEQYAGRGKVADWVYHDKPGNPHVHIMTSLRPLTKEGFGNKWEAVRDANGEQLVSAKGNKVFARWAGDRRELVRLREAWAVTANAHLAHAGREERIDHRSHLERDMETQPTRHRGPAAEAMEAADAACDRGRELTTENAQQFRKWERDPQLVVDHLTAEHSTFSDHQIAAAVFRYAPQRDRAERLMAEIAMLDTVVPVTVPHTDPDTGRTFGEARYTTLEVMEREERMMATASVMEANRSFGIDETGRDRRLAAIEDGQGYGYTAEQRLAIDHVTQNEGLAVLAGFAGAGKSTVMNAVRELYEAEGRTVVGGALAGKAAQGLFESSGIESRTLASWEAGWRFADEQRDEARANGTEPHPATQKARIEPGTVFVLDEAGMVASDQMGRIVERLHDAGAKLVLVGDARQLQPIEAGAAFRSIAERTGYVELTEVRRQREDWAARASVRFASGNALAGLSEYRVRDRIAFKGDRADARMSVLDGWYTDASAGRDTLMLAHTNRDVRALNEGARTILRGDGRLSEGIAFMTARGGREFAPGDRVLFLKNDRKLGVQNGRLGVVEAVRTEPADGADRSNGGDRSVDGDRSGRGDRAGGRGHDGADRNGDGDDNERAAVLTVRLDGEGKDGGHTVEIREDGYCNVDHGYAATVHKSQGATIDHVHALATGQMDAQLAYVAMTRHRNDVTMTVALDTFQTHEQRQRGERATPEQAMAKLATERLKDTSADYRGSQAHDLAINDLARIMRERSVTERAARFASVRGLPVIGEMAAELAERVVALRERLQSASERLEGLRSRTVERASHAVRERLNAIVDRTVESAQGGARIVLGTRTDRTIDGADRTADGTRGTPNVFGRAWTPSGTPHLPELSANARRGLERIAVAHRLRDSSPEHERHPRTAAQERRLVQVSRHELVNSAHAGELRRFARAVARAIDPRDIREVGSKVDAAAMMLAERYAALPGAFKERVLNGWELVHASAAGREVADRAVRFELGLMREGTREGARANGSQRDAPQRDATPAVGRDGATEVAPKGIGERDASPAHEAKAPAPAAAFERPVVEPSLPRTGGENAPRPIERGSQPATERPTPLVSSPAQTSHSPTPPASSPAPPALVAARTEWQRPIRDEARYTALAAMREHERYRAMEGFAREAFRDPKPILRAMEATVFSHRPADVRARERLDAETRLRGTPAELGDLRGRSVLGRTNEERRDALQAVAQLAGAYAGYARASERLRGTLEAKMPEQRDAFRLPLPAPSTEAMAYARSLRGHSVVMAADVMRGEEGNGRLDGDRRTELSVVAAGIASRFPFGADTDRVRIAQQRIGTFGPDLADPTRADEATLGTGAKLESDRARDGTSASPPIATIDDLVHAGRSANEAYRTEMVLEQGRERDRAIERDQQFNRGRDLEAER